MVNKLAGRERPTGVTILAILEIIVGIVSLISGLAITILFATVGGMMGRIPEAAPLAALFGAFGAVIGGLLILVSIVCFIIAYGFWKGKGWAWVLGLIFAIIGIISGLISLPGGIISIIINGLIIYYLTRPHVKEFFGRAAPTPPPPPPPPPPA